MKSPGTARLLEREGRCMLRISLPWLLEDDYLLIYFVLRGMKVLRTVLEMFGCDGVFYLGRGIGE